MPPIKNKKVEAFGSNNGLKSRLTSSIMGKNNSENNLPGLENNKSRLRLLEVTSRNDHTTKFFKTKRKTIFSPQGPVTKRTAFSDVTNAIQRLQFPLGNLTNKVSKDKKVVSSSVRKAVEKKKPSVILEEVPEDFKNATLYTTALEEVQESQETESQETVIFQTQSQPEAEVNVFEEDSTSKRCRSEPPAATLVEQTSSSVYITANESELTELVSAYSTLPSLNSTIVCSSPPWHLRSPDSPPTGVKNFDRETEGDTNSVSDYAPHIFAYLKSREPLYKVGADFLSLHPHLNHDLRSICVDWMVEVQETLELNHETLYLGVKNMDLFLSRPTLASKKYSTPPLPIKASRLRLIAAASLLLAAQYDERLPPPAEDWLQMCDQDYTVTELTTMQQQLFCALDFDLGAPLSYRFLRRYARACSIDMDLLTLSRYILESSLLHSQFSIESDSKLAAAGLWLALCMNAKVATQEERFALWTPALEHYSSYTVSEIHDIAKRLNAWLRSLPTRHLKTVHSKYSHRVFRKVALVPTLEEL